MLIGQLGRDSSSNRTPATPKGPAKGVAIFLFYIQKITDSRYRCSDKRNESIDENLINDDVINNVIVGQVGYA